MVQALFCKLEILGYKIDDRNLSPLHFKIPQVRFRMYILGIRDKRRKINWPELDVPKMTIKRKTNLPKWFIKNPFNPRLLSKEKKYLLRMWEKFLKSDYLDLRNFEELGFTLSQCIYAIQEIVSCTINWPSTFSVWITNCSGIMHLSWYDNKDTAKWARNNLHKQPVDKLLTRLSVN